MSELGEDLQELYLSDVQCAWDIYARNPDKGLLRLQVHLPDDRLESNVTNAVKLGTAIVDRMGGLKLSQKAASKCEQVRSKAEAVKREEQLKARREEIAERKEREEAEQREKESRMPRKQQEKLERRRRRAEQRQKMGKVMRKK